MVQPRGDQRGDRATGRRPLLDRVIVHVGNVDIARAIHRHAQGQIQPRGDQRGERVGGHVARTRLGHREGLAVHGQRATARCPRVGVEAEDDVGAASTALIGCVQVQPGIVRRGGPGGNLAEMSKHHTIRTGRRALQQERGPERVETILGYGQRLAGDGEGSYARRAQVGVKGERHCRAAGAALTGGAQMQPGIIRRGRPWATRRGNGERHAVAARRARFRQGIRPQRGGECSRLGNGDIRAQQGDVRRAAHTGIGREGVACPSVGGAGEGQPGRVAVGGKRARQIHGRGQHRQHIGAGGRGFTPGRWVHERPRQFQEGVKLEIGDIDIARAIHRHADGPDQPRGDQLGERARGGRPLIDPFIVRVIAR